MNILTLSMVYPNDFQPSLGLFIRERARHVARHALVRIVAPVPWSPLDPLIRQLQPNFRPVRCGRISKDELPSGHPRFFSLPGLAKRYDGYFCFLGILSDLRKIWNECPFDLIDAHFAYPEGEAARRLARKFNVPFTVTLRGTEVRLSRDPSLRSSMRRIFCESDAVIGVSRSLATLARDLGCPGSKLHVIPNGVDTVKFRPLDRNACRERLGIPLGAPVLLSVGGLVERKGYHHVIDVLPKLRERFPGVLHVIVGGASVEGDFTARLRAQVRELGLSESVKFEGTKASEDLPIYYSAADVFVLASSNEGWANVLMESMACGTPVVATDVGGNREVISEERLGIIVPYGNREALYGSLEHALTRTWERNILVSHAHSRSWDTVASEVLAVFRNVLDKRGHSEKNVAKRAGVA